MNNKSKFKLEEIKTELIVWSIAGPIMLLFILFFGIGILLLIPVCIAYGVVSMLLFIRTFNFGYVIKVLLFLFLTTFILLLFLNSSVIYLFFSGIIVLTFLILLIFLISNRYFKWKTTDLFELTAMPVKEVENGFTARPMHTGRIIFSWDELINFSSFISRNLISVVYYEKDKVVFGLNHSKYKLMTFSKDYSMDSWVAIDRTGNVNVHITKSDYNMFKDAYAFDQLCDTLGNVYADFFRLFQQGKKTEILKKLNNARN